MRNNICFLTGNLGTDAEVREFTNGKVVKLKLATSSSYKDKAGEWQEVTQWHSVDVWGNQANRAQMLKKGDRITLIGEINYNSTGEGQERKYYTTIKARSFDKLEKIERAQPADGAGTLNDQIKKADIGPPASATQAQPEDDLPF